MIDRLKKFEEALKASRDLAERFEAKLKSIGEEKSAANDKEAFAKAASALGFELTEADLEKAAAESEQLDPGELDAVAGGFEDEEWCLFDYCCFTAYHHPKHKEGDLEPCWKDFGCVTVYHHCTYESNPNK